MTKSSPPPVERAFTLIELLVVIAIIIGLAAILIPSLNSALESAKATKDLSNLRQIGALMQIYLNDKDRILPVNNGDLDRHNCNPVFIQNTSRADAFSNRLLISGPASETDTCTGQLQHQRKHVCRHLQGSAGNIRSGSFHRHLRFCMAPNYNGNSGQSALRGRALLQRVPDLPAGGGARR